MAKHIPANKDLFLITSSRDSIMNVAARVSGMPIIPVEPIMTGQRKTSAKASVAFFLSCLSSSTRTYVRYARMTSHMRRGSFVQ